MEIHELNSFTGALDGGTFLGVDDGTDTGKIAITQITDPLNDRIDTIITSPAPTEQEIIDARTGADGVTYTTLGNAINGQITDLTDELVDNNSYDILDKFTVNPTVSMAGAGITFTKNANGTYTFSGTATSTAFIRYFYNASSFPPYIKPGGTYYVQHKAQKVRFQIAAYYNNLSSSYTWPWDDIIGGTVQIPSNATGIMIRISIPSGTTVSETIDIPKILTGPSNKDLADITYDIKENTVANLLDVPYVPYSLVSGVTYTSYNGVCTLNGTSSMANWHRAFFDETNSFPSWAEYGKTYAVEFEPTGSHIDGLRFQVALYKSDSSYIWVCDTAENAEFTIPNNSDYVGMCIRLDIVENGTVIDATVSPKILNAKTNEMLSVELNDIKHSGAVTLIKSDQYYVRTKYDDSYDSVTAFRYPETAFNYTFNLRDARLINKDTSLADTLSAYGAASLYKDMHDEIPAFTINGVIVGSNHGNPNFCLLYCSHSLDETYIGTIWSDGTYNYTLVQLGAGFLICGTLDNDGELIFRKPLTLTKGNITLTIDQDESRSVQLRRSAINRKVAMFNDSGADVINGGGGAFIKVVEEYDICDQSKMLSWLNDHAGSCTNASYHDDAIPYKLASVSNTFIFNPNSTMTVYGTITAKEAITMSRLYGAMSLDFYSRTEEYNAGVDYGYVPMSNEFATPTALDYTTDMDITPVTGKVPYRFYQMSSTGAGKGFFLHLMDGLGDCDAETRATLNPFAWYDGDATKLYLQVLHNVPMTSGQSLSWGYGRGMYKKTANQTVNTCFRLNDAWVVAMDWHNNFSGYASLPKELAGGKITVMDKTNSVTVSSTYVGNNGIKVDCTGSGYCVLRVE